MEKNGGFGPEYSIQAREEAAKKVVDDLVRRELEGDPTATGKLAEIRRAYFEETKTWETRKSSPFEIRGSGCRKNGRRPTLSEQDGDLS